MSVRSESSDSASADESTSSTITLANGQQITTYHPQQRFDLLEGDPALVGPGAADLVNLALSRTPDDGRLRVAFDALHAQLRDVFNYVPAEVQLDEPNTVHGPRQLRFTPPETCSSQGVASRRGEKAVGCVCPFRAQFLSGSGACRADPATTAKGV